MSNWKDYIGPVLLIIGIVIFIILLSINWINNHSDEVIAEEINIIKQDTTFIYYTLPGNKLVEFGELLRDKQVAEKQPDRNISAYLTKEHQALWQFLRDEFDQEFLPYYNNGIHYDWMYHQISANALFVANTACFTFDDEQERLHYIKYK